MEELRKEEVLTENVEVAEVDEDLEFIELEPITSGGGTGKKVIAGLSIGALVLAGAKILWDKTKDKRDEHTVKSLEKRGYTVIKPAEPVTEIELEDDFYEDTDLVDERLEEEE